MEAIATGGRLERFERIEQILARPNFHPSINVKESEPETAIGIYRFPDAAKQKCGLSDCRTPHCKGFLVKMRDGRETLVGGHCGVKKFGLAFKSVMKLAQHRLNIDLHLDIIAHALREAPTTMQHVQSLIQRPGGLLALEQLRETVRKDLPTPALLVLRRMAYRDSPAVYTYRQLSKLQIEIRRQTGAQSRGASSNYERVQVGRIAGLAYWADDVRSILITDVQVQLQRLIQIYQSSSIPQDITATTLRKDSQWLTDLPNKLARAEHLIASGNAFFTRRNIQLLTYLSETEREIEGLADAVDRLIYKMPALNEPDA